ncbi:Lipase_(Class 3) and transmembrane domain-containing protein [Hexamita inflata]|uniref:sn-1-specific diacylglycerol lipase n=1 Tax=Hexamita inflata TaxID=28002 RepID=A0AA86PCK6_9EUKA|nr:Lipase (Class 3) and transmembrane domain-containing protein [Hexamita inflata]
MKALKQYLKQRQLTFMDILCQQNDISHQHINFVPSKIENVAELVKFCSIACGFVQARFHGFQKHGPSHARLVYTFMQDKLQYDANYLSYSDKQSILMYLQHIKHYYSMDDVVSIHTERSKTELYLPIFMVLKKNDQYVVVIKGTGSPGDVKTDFDFCPVKVDNFFFHRGFYKQALNVIAALHKIIGPSVQNIIFTGHSMGAAVSAVCVHLYQNNARAICYSTPASASYNFCHMYKHSIRSVIMDGDLVPQLSIHGLNSMLDRVKKQKSSFYSFKTNHLKESSAEISKSTVQNDSLFIPGEIIFCRKGTVQNLDQHELGEISLNVVMGIQHVAEREIIECLEANK